MKGMIAGLAVLLLASCGTEQTSATIEAEALVDAAWLNDNLGSVVVLDIRGGRSAGQAYLAGHVPSAIQAPYGSGIWRASRDGLPAMLPPVQDMERGVGDLGISNDDWVVIVPAGTSAAEVASATRVYWSFKVLGHDKVSILNGGYAAWMSAGYRAETAANRPAPASFTADYRPQLVATSKDVLAAVASGTPLIDARPSSYYLGVRKAGVAARYGTIREAKNIPPESLMLSDGGTFVGAEAAAAAWANAGISTEGEQITFCNIGHFASLAWFTAYEVLGNKDARLYDGSMAEWSADPYLPMDNTDNPARE